MAGTSKYSSLEPQGEEKNSKQKFSSHGVLTSPYQAKEDFFNWLYVLNPVSVQLRDQKQIKVYVSFFQTRLEPGKSIALFQINVFGAKRWFGALHTPHVTILRMNSADSN